MELHILTFIEQCSGLQGRRRCLAAGVLDIWHGTGSSGHGTEIFGTARIHQIWARHGTGRPCYQHMTPNRVNRAHWPNKENNTFSTILHVCWSMEKLT